MKKELVFGILIFFAINNFLQAQSMDDRIKTLANEIADQIVANGGTKVAVTTLDYKNCNTEFGKYLAEELTGYLSTSGKKVTVVNQKMLEALLIQNKLTAKGLLEAKNDAAKLGNVSGINSLVYGTITSFGDDLRLSLSVVKLPTLEVFGFAKSSLASTNSIKNMLPCLTENNIVDEIQDDDPQPTPSKDKNCGKTHTGTFIFVNNTSQDISISFSDFQRMRSFIIHPKAKETVEGIYVGGDGARTLSVNVKKNLKTGDDENHSIFVEECQIKTHSIK